MRGRAWVGVLSLGVLLAACGQGDPSNARASARAVANECFAAARAGDVERFWFLVHPDERAFFAWSVSLNQLEHEASDAGDAADAIRAEIVALGARHGIEDFDETSESTPNPASIDTVMSVVAARLEGVDQLALIRDARIAFAMLDLEWDPIKDLKDKRVASVTKLGVDALLVLGDDPEPILWLSRVSGAWYLRLRPPTPELVEAWRARQPRG